MWYLIVIEHDYINNFLKTVCPNNMLVRILQARDLSSIKFENFLPRICGKKSTFIKRK